MPPSAQACRILRFIQVVVVFLTVIHFKQSLSKDLLYGSRLGTFPKPDFRTNFTFSSNRGSMSFREIRHGLNADPFYVRVYAKPKDGNNGGFCFNGIGSSQSSPSLSSYGGLIYAYNSDYVRIWAPSDPSGRIVFVKDGWGGEVNTQESSEAEVVVEVWKYGPSPTFRIENVMGTQTNTTEVYLKVTHDLRQLPERVVVRLMSGDDFDNQTNPNGGFWFHAVGASQNPDVTGNFGGVVFAYNERYVRLWAPSHANIDSGCIFIGSDWGGGVYSQTVHKCRVEVLLWVNQLPTPTFQSEWFPLKGQRDQNSFKEIIHNLHELPALVNVQIRATNGRNVDYVFEAQGVTMSDDDGSNEYGGVVFAYDENRIRLWAPSKHDSSKKGYPLLVKHGWGGDTNLQDGNDKCMIRVVAYSSRCNGSQQVLYEGSQCITAMYGSYRIAESDWSQCSSICNNGTRTKSLTGCDVILKKTVLSCDFEAGMCGWSSTQQGGSSNLKWVLTDTATPKPDTGPLWGHPKGSFYAYTDTSKALPNQIVTLTSPNTHGAEKCILRFYWNMYGSDVGTLQVLVNTKDPRRHMSKWVSSGWSMIGSQGDIFWRSAFVNLESFNKVYQVQFQHILPEGNCRQDGSSLCTTCKNQRCPAANVAIDDIKLECQIVYQEHKPEVCTRRSAKLAGCVMTASDAAMMGPAYSIQQVDDETYVTAVGAFHDLIAVYEFEVIFTADYVVWKEMFGKTNRTNDVSFKIDDGDWLIWRPPIKGSHALWTQFYHQQFQLRPGIHRVSMRQEEFGFTLSRLALVPTKIDMWTDLGMQSRHIPDSSLTAFPSSSNPDPRYGRLHSQEAWCSSDHNFGYVYLQVKLPELALLSRISVQGGRDILRKDNNYWVKSFRMKVSLDGEKYTWYRDTGGRRTFQANADASTIVDHVLMFAAPVRGIRIYPWVWHNWICLRVELYGFYFSREMCASASPIPSTKKPCVGDKNCGMNAECRKLQASTIPKRIFEHKPDGFSTNATGRDDWLACHCDPGYHGSSCEHYGCTPNPCNNGTCLKTTNTFTCNCQRGYHGNFCQHPCLPGFYGKNCSHRCQCTEHGSCHIATGQCNCKLGYQGVNCEKVCGAGYFGYNCSQRCQCKNGASCDRVTGACNCTLGWSGALCDRPCPWNTWGVGCRLNCSCSQSAKFCYRFTGECICLPGFFGRNCQHPCPTGFYGRNCSYQCQCRQNSTCSAVDGTCSCTQPGWTGVLCDKACPGGYYGINCAKNCKCQNRAACDPVTGSCFCASGFSGQLCDKPCAQGWWGRNCSIPCHCVNGAICNPSNGQCSCPSASGCLCSPGWTGNDCSEPCPTGTWGADCREVCSCGQRAVCYLTNGSCSCHPGFMGSRCNYSCPQGTFGLNCSNSCFCVHGKCNATDGSCICDPGYHGYFCERPCPRGNFGSGCRQNCQCGNEAVCDHVTGQCTCRAGWAGRLCDIACHVASSSRGRFGADCSEKCVCPPGVPCDPVQGTCLCPRGFQGPNCLQTCNKGHYGLNCSANCSCISSATCDHIHGTCTCTPGWTGANCTDRCPAGSFGMLCGEKCECNANVTDVTASCDPVNGTCKCRPGYQGYKCEEQCSEGFYGRNCSQRCACVNGGVCSFINGTCSCLPGFRGKNCEQTCPPLHYGYNCSGTCQCVTAHSVSCSKADGTCTCSKGHIGVFCENVCPEGLYGHNCSTQCTCQNEAACDHVTGSCKCPAGYKGQNCETACDSNTFGLDCAQQCLCRNGATCNPHNGDCVCAAGYYGDQCTLECPGGRFGVGCKNNCDCNEANTKRCDKIDGACICHAGFIGVRCDEACEDGLYGEECKTPCPGCSTHVIGPCNKKTGNCTCSAGYWDYYCLDDCPLDRYGLHCAYLCACTEKDLCHHINGRCLDISRGKFSIIVSDTMEELGNDIVRQRNIKRGLERLMQIYFDLNTTISSASTLNENRTLARLSVLDGKNTSSRDATSDDNGVPRSASNKHAFMVRIMEFQTVIKEDGVTATRVVCVLLDNYTVIDGHYVDEVLSRIPSDEVSRNLIVEYYTGKLHKNTKSSTIAVHLPLIIGVSVGFFLVIIILSLFAIMRRKHKQKRGFALYKKSTKDQPEFELQPWIGRSTGYLLAFDNPYYDVLAAMGLDDDVEEDYYNPLYDDVSMYSDSGGNTSEDSCQKDLSAMVIRT